jgi:hypothetical protein
VTELLEDELLSDNEKAPKHVTVVNNVPATATCPECGTTFDGDWRNQKLGVHRFKSHGVRSKTSGAAKKRKAPAAKKKVPVKQQAKAKLLAPVPAGTRRKPASDIIRRIFVTVAKGIAPIDPPVAACLQFEAAAAGVALDKLVAGTFVDRMVVQKIANASEKWEEASSVVTLPLCVALCSRFPNMYPALEDDMREAIEDILIASVPVWQKKAERSKKAADALSEFKALDPVFAQSGDPVGEILRGMLPDYVFDPSKLPQPEEGPVAAAV